MRTSACSSCKIVSVHGRCVLRFSVGVFFFFFNDTATTEIYTLSLHDALPISQDVARRYRNSNLEVEHLAIALVETVDLSHEILKQIGRAHV